MPKTDWLQRTSPAFRLMIATSWLAPDSWKSNQEKAILEAMVAGPDWTEYLSLVADRHRTPAMSWAALSRVSGISIPEGVRRKLQALSDACRMQAVRHCLLLSEALRSFNRAGIPVMPHKGPILSIELYGDLGLRQSYDLDLAVPREYIFKAQACLEELGWRPDLHSFAMTPRQQEKWLSHEYDFVFVHSLAGCIFEVHWRNKWDTPVLTSSRWARSVPSRWQGCSFQAMNPSDLALYLCSHGGLHFWSRAKWLGDLARLHAAGRVDWDAALSEARKTGQERVLLTGLHLLEEVYGLPLPVLAGDARTDLLPMLTGIPLQALQAPEEAAVALGGFRYRLRLSRYERLLWPRKTWRESMSQLWYRREDFRAFPLPDSLFWAYVPLRPFLFAWRVVRKLFANPADA
jgi:hypothetical protein